MTKIETPSDTLLIIGNGFDLQCGLKSSYPDFFEWLNEKTPSKQDAPNFWTFRFLNWSPQGQLWVDIEDKLHNILNENKGPFGTLVNDVKLYFHQRSMSIKNSSATLQSYENQGRSDALYLVRRERKEFESGQKSSISRLSSFWFLDELFAFEHQFAEYLKDIMKGYNGYATKAARLLGSMTKNCPLVDIITFNYTNPFIDSDGQMRLRENVGNVTNVHGTLDGNNIIFGVDMTSDLPDEAHIFTKTYRKMFQDTPSRTLFPGVKTIKFYGSSLGKADYSYFQSIFDFYNLYGDSSSEPAKLEFYYTIYNEQRESDIKREATNKVYQLITAYGATLDNKDKGKNLLHKLLLEGRIQIIFLSNI